MRGTGKETVSIATACAAVMVIEGVAGHGIRLETSQTLPNQLEATYQKESGIISFPLLTHDYVINRRRLELASSANGRQLKNQEYDKIATDVVETKDRIPLQRSSHRYLGAHAQQQLGALYQGYGTHYIDIWVGYPPQRQTAVVDTGSSVTAFPCSECKNCGRHTDVPFNETASKSFRTYTCPLEGETKGCHLGTCSDTNQCIIEHLYGSGEDTSSWRAFEAEDVAYAGGPHDRPIDGAAPLADPNDGDNMGENPLHASDFSFPLSFGCQTSVSGYFEKQLASGVMGMDRRAQSFWGQMKSSQAIHKAQFSLCFVRQPVASVTGTTAGAVTLGGVDTRLHTTGMVFAKATGEGTTASFKVRVRKFYLRENGGTSSMYDPKSAIHQLGVDEDVMNGPEEFAFDSGTTDTYFTKALSNEFRRVWREVTGYDFSNDPMPLTDSQLRKAPTILLQMVPHEGGVGDEIKYNDPREVPGLAGKVDMGIPNDVLFAVPATHYMQHSAKDNTYTARIYLDRDISMGSVLGSNAMMGHDILFDMDAARIGFAESNCDYARLVAERGSASTMGAEINPAESTSNGVPGAPEAVEVGTEVDDHKVCGTLKCRGFAGLTLSVIFLLFFVFARRYVTRRDDGGKQRPMPEYEMKTTGSRTSGELSDVLDVGTSPREAGGNAHYSGGEHGGYRDRAPSKSYSDRPRHYDNEDDGHDGASDHNRRHQSSHSSSRRDRDYNSSYDEESYRSRDSYLSRTSRGEGSYRSTGGSVKSEHSSRSQRSSGTHQSTRSHRSSGSHHSNRSASSRESHRSHASHRSSTSSRDIRRSHDRYSDGEYERSSSRRDNRYRDYYEDEVPMPPSIS